MISERHKPKDYDWAFDLRANFADSDDSEGEDDRKTGTANSGLSRDDALLKEIDISSRSDSVNFKPNPFSIAKINAIYRSARAKEPGNQRSPQPPTIQTLNNNQQKSQTKITDRFKVKASKAALPTLSPARPLHSKHSPLEGNSCQLHELVPSSPSSHVIIPGQERCNFDSQDFSAANKHPPKNPGVPLNSIPANISRDSSSNFVRTSSPPQKHAHILAQKRLPGPTIEPQLKENNIVESNRGNFRHSTRFPRIPNRPSFSSPLRPPGWKSLQNGLHKTSSPGPSGCLPRRFLPLAQLTRPSLPNYCDDDRDLPVRSPNLTNRMPNQAEPNTIRSKPIILVFEFMTSL
ncbi:hypothetical protein CPB83DRAFT_548704 [Crepidotus variabilis]|uniref:Uncharacterized protein n=1 Tax=Crepidotus variabilis TaxID=179855 RepID=A0A9P6EAG0_9AGAR|nr:hypothetical protein CPB83DRAFT_548704 [Crepidotus variabilis]